MPKIQLNKIQLYKSDLHHFKKKLNEIGKNNTSEEDISELIRIERKINECIKFLDNFTIKYYNKEANEDFASEIQESLEKFDYEYNLLRIQVMNFLSRIMI